MTTRRKKQQSELRAVRERRDAQVELARLLMNKRLGFPVDAAYLERVKLAYLERIKLAAGRGGMVDKDDGDD